MSKDLEHKIHVTIGIFVLSCFGATLFYDVRDMLVICLVGLAIIGAILNAVRKLSGGK